MLEAVLDKFEEMGVEVTRGDNWIELDMQGKRPKAVFLELYLIPNFQLICKRSLWRSM